MRKWQKIKKHPNIYKYETENGTLYGLRKGYTDALHRRSEFIQSGFKTVRAAEIKLHRFEIDLADGKIGLGNSKNVTFEEYFSQMLERKESLNILKDTTASFYQRMNDNHLKEKIGKLKLKSITRPIYQKVIDDFIKQGFTYHTIKDINSIVQQVFNDAELNDLIPANKLKKIEIVNTKKTNRNNKLEPDEYARFMKLAKEILTRQDYGAVLFVTLGARRSEVNGLRPSSFEFFKNENGVETAAITWKEQRTEKKENGTTLKNKSSYRTNHVTGEIVTEIHYLIKLAKDTRKKYGIDDPDGFLWINPKNGKMYSAPHIYTIFRKINNTHRLKTHVNPHLFRHYFASQALSNPDVSPAAAMHWLGHSNLQMTTEYSRDDSVASLNLFETLKEKR